MVSACSRRNSNYAFGLRISFRRRSEFESLHALRYFGSCLLVRVFLSLARQVPLDEDQFENEPPRVQASQRVTVVRGS